MVPRASKPADSNAANDQHPTRNAKRGSRLVVDCLRRRPGVVLLLLPAALLASLYVVSSEEDYDFEPRYPPLFKSYNVAEGNCTFCSLSRIPDGISRLLTWGQGRFGIVWRAGEKKLHV